MCNRRLALRPSVDIIIDGRSANRLLHTFLKALLHVGYIVSFGWLSPSVKIDGGERAGNTGKFPRYTCLGTQEFPVRRPCARWKMGRDNRKLFRWKFSFSNWAWWARWKMMREYFNLGPEIIPQIISRFTRTRTPPASNGIFPAMYTYVHSGKTTGKYLGFWFRNFHIIGWYRYRKVDIWAIRLSLY